MENNKNINDDDIDHHQHRSISKFSSPARENDIPRQISAGPRRISIFDACIVRRGRFHWMASRNWTSKQPSNKFRSASGYTDTGASPANVVNSSFCFSSLFIENQNTDWRMAFVISHYFIYMFSSLCESSGACYFYFSFSVCLLGFHVKNVGLLENQERMSVDCFVCEMLHERASSSRSYDAMRTLRQHADRVDAMNGHTQKCTRNASQIYL